MKYIFFLSGDYAELGKEEVISLFDVNHSKFADRLVIADLDNKKEFVKTFRRMALAKSVYRLLFECKTSELIGKMKSFGWNSAYKPGFCLRIYDFNDKPNNGKNNKKNKKSLTASFSEKKLAGYVWRSVQNPKVSLDSPKTLIQLFIIKDKSYCGLLVYANNEDFESRKSHLRPFPHPSSLHPKVARALVNITGIKENEILLDPFCGTGGFLIESGLMNIKSIGYDIDKIMINGCIENLRHYHIKKYRIKRQNALKISDKFDYAVTDLPYGLNSNAMAMYEKDRKKHRINKKIEAKDFIKNLEKFYLKFLKNLRKKLKKKAVIVFPSYVNYKKLLKQSKFRIETEFSIYVHRSLTRKIVKVR